MQFDVHSNRMPNDNAQAKVKIKKLNNKMAHNIR
jgi:hypothetical protein